ncbi:alpha/beta fold hydrolase, partial [Flavobacterium circumlabens]
MTTKINFDSQEIDYTVYYQYINVEGIKIGYREAGLSNQNVLFLLHGYPSSSVMFKIIIPILAKHFRVIAVDMPAFGFSDVPSADNFDYTFENYARFISAFMLKLDIGKASFYLFDYGAPILMRCIAQNPEMVKMLIFQN